MTEQELEAKFNELAKEYEFLPGTIRKWYETLKEYPFFDDKLGMICLETLCQKRISSDFDTEYPEKGSEYKYGQSLKDCIDYALYSVYGDVAKPFITSEGIDHDDPSDAYVLQSYPTDSVLKMDSEERKFAREYKYEVKSAADEDYLERKHRRA